MKIRINQNQYSLEKTRATLDEFKFSRSFFTWSNNAYFYSLYTRAEILIQNTTSTDYNYDIANRKYCYV